MALVTLLVDYDSLPSTIREEHRITAQGAWTSANFIAANGRLPNPDYFDTA
jgi:hypothetical protein